MAQVSGPLRLRGAVGKSDFFQSVSSIKPGFKRGTVLSSNPTSTWIMYTRTEWCHSDPSGKAIIIRVEDDTIDVGEDIRSIQGFDNNDPSIYVFEHFDFKGYGAYFTYSQPTLTSFPNGRVDGVSSAIVVGGKWSFFTGYNYTGISVMVGGKKVFEVGNINFTGHLAGKNKIMSISRVG